ncbi:MAG: glycoside hydrolase family 3 C-terminal domain-containing protein [Prevotella sp.]|nr:glycoside hydrolase family 3 C-terminal domain-containing protein [Prevotella sp.]
MKKKTIISLMLTVLLSAAKAQTATPVYLNPDAPVEQRVKDALSRMTVHEKVQLLHAQSKFTTAGVPRLGIRQLNMADGPHGVRQELEWNTWKQAYWTNDSVVAFPSLTCLAATWNTHLSGLYGNALSEEFAFRGKDMILGPGANIARTPYCGRNFEYMGEDPFLAGEMIVPYIQRAQANGVACCLKHFALNNQEIDRGTVNVNVSERALNEIYLPAFKKAVEQGGLWAMMGSYNRWNNKYCCHNDSLVNGILKGDWGFDGAYVSDWGGTHSTWEAAMGGLDIEMGTHTDGMTTDKGLGYNTYYLADEFEKLVKQGKVPMEVLDDKASRVLRTIFRTSMNARKVIGSLCSEAHYDVCRQIAEEGIVMLKNNKDMLPLNLSRYKSILVVGENATRSLTKGGGSSELKTLYDVSPLEGIRTAVRKMAGDDVEVMYAQGYESGRAMYGKVDSIPQALADSLSDEALAMAARADLVIYVGGMNKNRHEDCENGDRRSYSLSFGQDQLISRLAAVQRDIVVVTFGGNAFATPWIDDVRAMLHCWYLGSESGTALARILTGEVCPSGKLPVTFAVNGSDYPFVQYGEEAYPGKDGQVYYREGVMVGYRWFDTKDIKPRFPFGYGLSFTTFRYSKPVLSSDVMTGAGDITLSVDITNTGKREGKETVQLYIGDEQCSVERPEKELKGFAKVSLMPGETKTVTFTIKRDDLCFFSEQLHAWTAEPGWFKAYVCASQTDVRGVARFEYK